MVAMICAGPSSARRLAMRSSSADKRRSPGLTLRAPLERLQRNVEFSFVQGGLRPRKQNLSQALQALVCFPVVRIENQRIPVKRERAAVGRIDEVPIDHRSPCFLDE